MSKPEPNRSRKERKERNIVLFLGGSLSRDEQLSLLYKAVAELEQELREGRDMMNRVLEIETDGECNFYDLPPA